MYHGSLLPQLHLFMHPVLTSSTHVTLCTQLAHAAQHTFISDLYTQTLGRIKKFAAKTDIQANRVQMTLPFVG